MDFKHPERCQPQRTGREDRHSKFYEIPDNLPLFRGNSIALNHRLGRPSRSLACYTA